MNQRHPLHPTFQLLEWDRRLVTGEESPAGSHHDVRHQDIDWIGADNQGGGYVPPDFEWRSNPKQEHDQQSAG